MSTPTTFENLRAAIAAYDAGEAERAALLDAAMQAKGKKAFNAAIAIYDAAVSEANERLAVALHADTRDYNSLENCRLVGVKTLREWTEKYKSKQAA